MLKAKIIEDAGTPKAVYYRRRQDQPVRSLSLRDCMDKVFTNVNDPTRRNLELVEELRDQGTHLVIRQVPRDVISLFQACVVNYHNRLHAWFGWNLSQRVNVGMMSIVYDLGPEQFDLSNQVLRRKLGKETATYLANFQARLQEEFNSLGRPLEFSIGINYKLALTQKPSDADIVLTKGAGGNATAILEVPKDPYSTHPYRQKELLQRLNEEFGGRIKITGHDIKCMADNYQIKKRSEFFYKGRVTGSPGQYSDRFVDWILQQHKNDGLFFTKLRNKAKANSSMSRRDEAIRTPQLLEADVLQSLDDMPTQLVPQVRQQPVQVPQSAG